MITTDNWFQPCSAAVRAVNEAAEALRRRGHEVEIQQTILLQTVIIFQKKKRHDEIHLTCGLF